MTLIELLELESTKHSGKPLLLDNIRKQMNVSGEEWMNALIELVSSGACVLSSATGSDGNVSTMIQYILPSVDEPVNEVLMKSATKGRPKVSPELKRVVVSHIRLPSWMVECLKGRGNSGKVVEKALLEYYCLSPPV